MRSRIRSTAARPSRLNLDSKTYRRAVVSGFGYHGFFFRNLIVTLTEELCKKAVINPIKYNENKYNMVKKETFESA